MHHNRCDVLLPISKSDGASSSFHLRGCVKCSHHMFGFHIRLLTRMDTSADMFEKRVWLFHHLTSRCLPCCETLATALLWGKNVIRYTTMTTERGQTVACCLSEQTTKLSERHRVQSQDTLLGELTSTCYQRSPGEHSINKHFEAGWVMCGSSISFAGGPQVTSYP